MEDVLAVYLKWFTNWSTRPFGQWLDRQHKAVQWSIKGAAGVVAYLIVVLIYSVVMALVQIYSK